jgi:hypothetical protein
METKSSHDFESQLLDLDLLIVDHLLKRISSMIVSSRACAADPILVFGGRSRSVTAKCKLVLLYIPLHINPEREQRTIGEDESKTNTERDKPCE